VLCIHFIFAIVTYPEETIKLLRFLLSNNNFKNILLPHRDAGYLFIIIHYLFIFLAVVFFSLILKISNRWKQTEKEKLNAELSFLKAQINPHFLFNTLNNIYSLSLEKSENTPAAVLELSAMMRYVIDDADAEFVPLETALLFKNERIMSNNSQLKLIFY